MIALDGVEMVDVREAASLAHRTPETIRRWVWHGRLPSTKQGNRLLVPRRAVLELVGADADPADPPRPSLAQWAEQVTAARTGEPGVTAADLVRDDRAGR